MHGTGTMKFADGSEYVGKWENGKRHGQGVFTTKDRCKYTGNYSNGLK